MTANRNDDSKPGKHKGHWYKQPVAWLGIAITLGIILACIWTIMVATRYDDHHVSDQSSSTILGVPIATPDKSSSGDE